MPANKYLVHDGRGGELEQRAQQTSAGAGDGGKIVALTDTGYLDQTLLPTGVGPDTAVVTASEALAAGDFVQVYSNAGAFAVRKADASVAGKEANGFVLGAVSSGASATVYFAGRNTSVTGQAPGRVFLSPTTAGRATATAPSASGQVVQVLGVAVAATEINFEATLATITLA